MQEKIHFFLELSGQKYISFHIKDVFFSAMFVFAILVFYYFCTLKSTQKKTDDEYNNISLTHLRSCA